MPSNLQFVGDKKILKLTFYMLNTEFVHETGREYTRSEGTTEDI